MCEIYICLVDMKYFTLLKIEETRGEITRYLFLEALNGRDRGRTRGRRDGGIGWSKCSFAERGKTREGN